MTHRSKVAAQPLPDAESTPILFLHGCSKCLDISRTLSATISGLAVIDLSKLSQFKKEAMERGVTSLPSLVIDEKVLPVSPHSHIDHID